MQVTASNSDRQPADGLQLAVSTPASTGCYADCAGKVNAASPFSSDGGKRYDTPPVSPRRLGDIVAAALHLTHFEYRYLPKPC